jgi:hypothetical protein
MFVGAGCSLLQVADGLLADELDGSGRPERVVKEYDKEDADALLVEAREGVRLQRGAGHVRRLAQHDHDGSEAGNQAAVPVRCDTSQGRVRLQLFA